MSDFTIVNMSTIIPPEEFEACLQLAAVDDEIVEDHEFFIVMVEALNPNDVVNGTASIIISDNDGKDHYTYSCKICNKCFFLQV